MKATVKVRYHTKSIAPDGSVLSEQRGRNLVLNYGLDALAQGNAAACKPAEASLYCYLGMDGSSNFEDIDSQYLFTKDGVDVIESNNGYEFPENIVGMTFKAGTDTSGFQGRIVERLSDFSVRCEPSSELFTGQPGRLWHTERETLLAMNGVTNTYRQEPGDNGYSIVGNEVTFWRTYIFAPFESEFDIWEIGWSSTENGNVLGRAVLATPDPAVEGGIYIVRLELIFAYSPTTPSAHQNVSTSMDDNGTAMIEQWSLARVQADGSIASPNGNGLDGSASVCFKFDSGYTQNLIPQDTANSSVVWNGDDTYCVLSTSAWDYADRTGEMALSFPKGTLDNYSIAEGSSFTAVGFGRTFAELPNNRGELCYDILFNEPLTYTASSTPFDPAVTFIMAYDQVLDNSAVV